MHVESAIAYADFEKSWDPLVRAITDGAAHDVHLRYEAAWHLAKHADEKALTKLLASEDANVRLAGLIAIDVACYENFPTKIKPDGKFPARPCRGPFSRAGQATEGRPLRRGARGVAIAGQLDL